MDNRRPQPIRIVIADDHPIFRDGLRRLLESEADLKVIGEASDGAEAVKLARQLKPDILLLDLAMPRHPGLEALRELSLEETDLEEVRPYFRALRELKDKLIDLNLPEAGLNELSMGMTHDFPVAIEEGATIVRIGTALFGIRGH